MAKHEPHPYADLFPMMTAAELDALAADIKENGQQSPVIVDQHGLVIDGRNRLDACERAGKEPVVEERDFKDGRSVLRFIMSANQYRRHLNESQRALIAEKAANLRDGQKLPVGSGSPNGRSIPLVSLEEAAGEMDVSERATSRARKVKQTAVPEVVEMVKAGAVSLRKAEEFADLPEEEQREIAARGPAEVNKVVGQMRREPGAGTGSAPANGRAGKDPVGITVANEALNVLKRIPKDDPNRESGFRLVIKTLRAWLRASK